MLQLYPLQSGEEKLLNTPVFVLFCFVLFFFFPGSWQAPKAEDRAQVVSRDVRLPNAPPTTLDDQDAQIVSSQAISIVVTSKWHFGFFNISIADSVAHGVLGPCSE
jgi:hypothetical protein